MPISTFEPNLPDEIILIICRYLSSFYVVTSFFNLNTRLNRTISHYCKQLSVGNDCHLKEFKYGCSFFLHHQSSLFSLIRTLIISNRGSPLVAKYFLSHIPIQNMIYLENLTLIDVTDEEMLSYLDVIEKHNQNTFQHLVTFNIRDSEHIGKYIHETFEEYKEYQSIIINRILTANKQRLKSITIDGYDRHMHTKFNIIQDPCINLHKLSITSINGDELIMLFAIIPNIRYLRVSLGSTPTLESSLWSSIVLPYLFEFYLYGGSISDWCLNELITLLRLMPAIQRLSLQLRTTDERLLDGQHVRAALSAANILHLNSFNYSVEYGGSDLEHNLVFNLPQTWLPQLIAVACDAECSYLCLHTIPCIFHRFWTQTLPKKTETPRSEQKPISRYGDNAYMTECYAYIPRDLTELYVVMQRSSRVKNLILCISDEYSGTFLELKKEVFTPMPTQQRFYITSLRLRGNYCDSVQWIQLLTTFGSYLRKLRIDFHCFSNLINNYNNSDQLKTTMLHRNLIYLEIDTIHQSEIDSGAFFHVIAFLFASGNNLRHMTLFLMWYLEIFQSSEDMESLTKILRSFKHGTQLISIVIYNCLFSKVFCNTSQTISVKDHFREWLNHNTHLTYERYSDLECDISDETLKLWLEYNTNNIC